MTSWQIITGDCREVLQSLPAQSVHTCITSPPYFGLRDYGHDGQIGLEPTPDEFVAALVEVFREVRRVLRDDGTAWVNLGDSYAGSWGAQSRGGPPSASSTLRGNGHVGGGPKAKSISAVQIAAHPKGQTNTGSIPPGASYKPKDLHMIPALVALALRADGWYLRADIVWAKPNPMPESVTDRPTRAHEYVFLLSKRASYFYDSDAVREGAVSPSGNGYARPERESYKNADGTARGQAQGWTDVGGLRNRRSVWTVATQPYAGAHFATFPPKLIEPCILAGAPERACGECGAPWMRVLDSQAVVPGGEHGRERVANKGAGVEETPMVNDGERRRSMNGRDWAATFKRETLGFEPSCPHGDGSAAGVVLDPFAGAGTTGMVALQHGRSFVGIELNSEYAEMARWRIRDDAPLLNGHTEIAA